MKLQQLIQYGNIYIKMYSKVTDFDRAMRLSEVIEQIQKHQKIHDKTLENLRDRLHKDPDSKDEINKQYQKMLEKDVDLTLPKVKREEIEGVGFNPIELMEVKRHLEK